MSQELLDMVSNGLGSTTSIVPDDILVRHSISNLKKIQFFSVQQYLWPMLSINLFEIIVVF